MDNLLSYIDIFEYCSCTEIEYKCYKKNDFIKCRYKDFILKLCPYLNILIEPTSKFNLIEKPTEYSSCDNSEQYKKIFKFLTVLISKQDEYCELSKTVGMVCIVYITLTNIKYNVIPKAVFHVKLDEIIIQQKENIKSSLCNLYKMTRNFNKSCIIECINTIDKWKEYI